jgi:hypothetical protein
MVRFRTVGDITCTAPVESDADSVARRSSPRRRSPRSPSAAPRASTTRPRTRRWSNARRKAISDVRDRKTPPEDSPRQRPAALSHLRQRRRRQEHADRPPAVRQQDHPRRHPARHRAHLEKRGLDASTCRCSPTACRPSANRASPSTSPTATSPPARASTSSPTPRATSSTRATWSPPRRPPTWRSSSSTPARAC